MNIPTTVKEILARLRAAGYAAYMVGGCVRDSLLGLTPGDWDVCTAALPEQTKAVFAGERLIETGLRHGTVTVLLRGTAVEITTFRLDGDYPDGRHPAQVSFTPSLTEDLRRRDFTCNAMALDEDGGLLDPFGGQTDMAAGLLRAVGEADVRFREDALRLLRALRFASRLGFRIEPETARALHRNRELLRNISAERIFSELKGIVAAPHAVEVLREFSDVLFVVLPELAPLKDYNQCRPAHSLDAWEHTLHAMAATADDVILRLALLFHDCGKPDTRIQTEGGVHYPDHAQRSAELTDAALRRLRCDTATRCAVVQLVALHSTRPPKTSAAARHELYTLGTEQAIRLMQVRMADAAGHCTPRGDAKREEDCAGLALLQTVLAEGFPLSLRELAIDGETLLALGASRGKAMGELLNALLNEVLDGTLENSPAALRDRATALLASFASQSSAAGAAE